jgi:hypothetical protein
LFIVVFISGCSVARKSSVVNTEDAVAGTISEKTIVERNLTKGNFYIQKAEIELYSVGETVNLLATLKYQKEGRYLITVRTRSGVEVVRILMANDTLLANDRINKKLYQGSTSYLKSKYGISFSTLPVILGDYIYDNNIGEGIIVCNRGKAEIIKNEGNRRINYIVSCKEKKVAVARFSSETGEGKIEIELADFIRDGNYLYPRSCQIMDTESKSVIKIKIKKIEFDTDNNLKFIPGSNYEKVVLK